MRNSASRPDCHKNLDNFTPTCWLLLRGVDIVIFRPGPQPRQDRRPNRLKLFLLFNTAGILLGFVWNRKTKKESCCNKGTLFTFPFPAQIISPICPAFYFFNTLPQSHLLTNLLPSSLLLSNVKPPPHFTPVQTRPPLQSPAWAEGISFLIRSQFNLISFYFQFILISFYFQFNLILFYFSPKHCPLYSACGHCRQLSRFVYFQFYYWSNCGLQVVYHWSSCGLVTV